MGLGQTASSQDSAAAAAVDWPALIGRLVRGLDRSTRQWTPARRKDSVQRVMASSARDAQRLHERLDRLIASWEGGEADAPLADAVVEPPAAGAVPAAASPLQPAAAAPPERPSVIAADRLLDEYAALALALTDSLATLAEDDSFAAGQLTALRQRLAEPPSARGLRSARALLADTRRRQRELQQQRAQARQALRALLESVIAEIGALDSGSREMPDRLAGFAARIAAAGSLGELSGLVGEMTTAAQALQSLVAGARDRLQHQRRDAEALQKRVQELEDELRRLDSEVSTDALTQVANRRGLMQAFEAAAARHGDAGAPPLAIGLIDIDNFKKLNDGLGHAAGDVALQSLAREVQQRLRGEDRLARFGGEEFVLLLPGLVAAAAQAAVTRLQRELSAALFLHQGREVFVTFSAGVTAWQPGEPLEAALERADAALYEAKRTGKNRTCIG